jgi:hypothetical protein
MSTNCTKVAQNHSRVARSCCGEGSGREEGDEIGKTINSAHGWEGAWARRGSYKYRGRGGEGRGEVGWSSATREAGGLVGSCPMCPTTSSLPSYTHPLSYSSKPIKTNKVEAFIPVKISNC